MEENIETKDSTIKDIDKIPLSTNEKRFSSRASTARKTREEDERAPIVFGGGSRFNLPINVLKKLRDTDKVLGFVVYSSGNTEQKENYYDAIERGWKPLDAREYPELIRQYELSPFGDREEDYLVRKGGQIAMIRDKATNDAEADFYDSEKQRQEYMSSMYKQADPRFPRPFIDERIRDNRSY